jgi:hypothetical protein
MAQRFVFPLIVLSITAAVSVAPSAQQGTATSPRARSPIDLTGYWVSVVNEDW